MSDAAWKDRERKVCAYLGLKRRGADTVDERGGKNDCMGGFASVEITNRKRPGFSIIRQNIARAQARARADEIPIAVTYAKGMRLEDGVVSMTLKDFRDWFGTADVGR